MTKVQCDERVFCWPWKVPCSRVANEHGFYQQVLCTDVKGRCHWHHPGCPPQVPDGHQQQHQHHHLLLGRQAVQGGAPLLDLLQAVRGPASGRSNSNQSTFKHWTLILILQFPSSTNSQQQRKDTNGISCVTQSTRANGEVHNLFYKSSQVLKVYFLWAFLYSEMCTKYTSCLEFSHEFLCTLQSCKVILLFVQIWMIYLEPKASYHYMMSYASRNIL